MKLRHSIFIAFAIILSTVSCTISKRLYNPGYNIDWNTKSHASNKIEQKHYISKQDLNEIALADNRISSSVKPDLPCGVKKETLPISNYLSPHKILKEKSKDKKTTLQTKINKRTSTTSKPNDDDDDDKTISPAASGSFALALDAILLILLSYFLLGIESSLFLFTYLLAVLFAIFACVLGRKALKAIKENTKLKGKWFATIGITIGLMILALQVILIVYAMLIVI